MLSNTVYTLEVPIIHVLIYRNLKLNFCYLGTRINVLLKKKYIYFYKFLGYIFVENN